MRERESMIYARGRREGVREFGGQIGKMRQTAYWYTFYVLSARRTLKNNLDRPTIGLSGLITDILHKINVNNNNVLIDTCTNDNLEKCTSKIIWIYYYGIMVEYI